MPGMIFGLYFTSINLLRNDFRAITGLFGLILNFTRLFYIGFIFTNN